MLKKLRDTRIQVIVLQARIDTILVEAAYLTAVGQPVDHIEIGMLRAELSVVKQHATSLQKIILKERLTSATSAV